MSFDTAANDASAMGEYLLVFLPNLHGICAETAISELSVKIVTPPLDSATPILIYGMDVSAIGGRLPCNLDLWLSGLEHLYCIGCDMIKLYTKC